MTWAVCLHCGKEKFGALCPCPKCGVASSGNMDLDIVFSTHQMSMRDLRHFGSVVGMLRGQCDDEKVCFWAFLLYVSEKHPDLLNSVPPAEFSERAKELLSKVDIQELPPKKWWEFWKR